MAVDPVLLIPKWMKSFFLFMDVSLVYHIKGLELFIWYNPVQ